MLLDLSRITDALISELTAFWDTLDMWVVDPSDDSSNEFTPEFSGNAPDANQDPDTAYLNLFLFHVAADGHNLNSFPGVGLPRDNPPGPLTIPQQPLSLTLHYLMTARAPTHNQEQQAMSAGIKCFHEHPFFEVVGKSGHIQRATLTLESYGTDELSRLWQAASTPLRLSAVYRVGVVFIEPQPHTWTPPSLLLDPQVHATPIVVKDLPPNTREVPITPGFVDIPGDGFVSGEIEIYMQINVAAIKLSERTVPGDPDQGEFKWVNATTVKLRIPKQVRVSGRYRTLVIPAADKPRAQLWLNVVEASP